MSKIKLYIAASLDGYIADEHGSVDWLYGHDKNNQETSYEDFIKDIDVVVMGWNTYHQIITELSLDDWVYKNQITYVMSHREKKDIENIKFTSKDVLELVKELKKVSKKDIWICGGANVIKQFMDLDFIDEYCISIIPVILGKGKYLFGKGEEKRLSLREIRQYNGIVDLVYERQKQKIE